jgi:hypothetical protein
MISVEKQSVKIYGWLFKYSRDLILSQKSELE